MRMEATDGCKENCVTVWQSDNGWKYMWIYPNTQCTYSNKKSTYDVYKMGTFNLKKKKKKSYEKDGQRARRLRNMTSWEDLHLEECIRGCHRGGNGCIIPYERQFGVVPLWIPGGMCMVGLGSALRAAVLGLFQGVLYNYTSGKTAKLGKFLCCTRSRRNLISLK